MFYVTKKEARGRGEEGEHRETVRRRILTKNEFERRYERRSITRPRREGA